MELIDADAHLDCVKEIVSAANRYVIFLSPFWCLGDRDFDIHDFDEVFENALKRGVRILLLCGSNQLNLLREYYRNLYSKYDRRCSVFYIDVKKDTNGVYVSDFHAKLYMNEKSVLVTSRNISGFKSKSVDLGILVSEACVIEDIISWLKKLFLEAKSNSYLRKFFKIALYE